MRPDLRARLVGLVAALLGFMVTATAFAGGPRYVAGSTYFGASLKGQAVVWAGGQITFFTDQGALSSSVSNATANATVAAAAAVWSAVPTAALSIIRGGTLAEDVNGSSVTISSDGVILPADIQSDALATPVGIVYDEDGSVIDAFFGTGASNPDNCIDSAAIAIVDNLAANGTIVHALILINGRCTGTAAQLQQIQFQLIRAFGRVLGLGWSQANDAVLSRTTVPSYQQLEGWPIMRPIDIDCNQLSTRCVPNPLQLRADDTAALSRLYPVTMTNRAQFPGKLATGLTTISIHGSAFFRRGQGMQGVNVVARPISPGVLQPDDRYPVSSVTGFLYTGNAGNSVTGLVDNAGVPRSNFGSDDPLLEGFYDLSGIPLPPGESEADFQLNLEPVNPLYNGGLLVGPYSSGTPAPSGTLPSLILRHLSAGMTVEQDFTINDSAGDLQFGYGGSSAAPASMPATGEWQGRIPDPRQSSWFVLPVLAGRRFTIESQAVDDAGDATEDKLRPVIGVWDGVDSDDSPAVTASAAPFNGASPGVTAISVDTKITGELRIALADQRGDGRPDYAYQGRLLYAASVTPQRLPQIGGTVQIVGSGFRPGMTVALGAGIPASVTHITPTLIVANAPLNPLPTGSLDLVVSDPSTNGTAVIAGGISYGAASGDTMAITTALPATLNLAAAAPFAVRVFAADQVTPVGGLPVTFSVLNGSAALGLCGVATCTVITGDDGYATALLSPGASGLIRVQATLTTGVTLTAETVAFASPAILPVVASLFLAPGTTLSWVAQVHVTAGLGPLADVPVTWAGQSVFATQTGTSLTNVQGLASFTFSAGPWPAGTSMPITACVAGTYISMNLCSSLSMFVAHPETEALLPVSGWAQTVQEGNNPIPIVVRLVAPNGQPVVGGGVYFFDSLRSWTPDCARGSACPAGRLLSAGSQTSVSDVDGLASFVPALPEGIPLRMTGQAQAGASAVIPFTVDIFP